MSTRTSDAECSRAGSCRKGTHTFTDIMPGVFAVFCPHGICLGVFFMSKFESPETFFSIIMQRRRVAPRVLIGDNLCLGQHFAMNREPHFFKDVSWFLDGMHNYGHVACSTGFCIAHFPDFDVVNTEVAEQFFSLLDRITNPVSFMGVEHATKFVRLFIAFQNRVRRQYWSMTGASVSDAARGKIQAASDKIDALLSKLSR